MARKCGRTTSSTASRSSSTSRWTRRSRSPRCPVGRQPYWNVTSKDGKTVYVACPSSDDLIAFDVATKKEKARFQFPKGSHPTRMLVVAAPRGQAVTSR